MDSSESSEYSFFTETKINNLEENLIKKNNFPITQLYLFKNGQLIGKSTDSIIIVTKTGEKKKIIKEISMKEKDTIKSIILLKNEDLLYSSYNSIYCIKFIENNLDYIVINTLNFQKEKIEIINFYEMKDGKIICASNSGIIKVISQTKLGIYQVILTFYNKELAKNGIYEINKLLIFINEKRCLNFYNKYSFVLIKKLDSLNAFIDLKENWMFKKDYILNNCVLEINKNLIAISTLGNGIFIINTIKFIIVKNIINLDFTCWIKLKDGSFITCEYTDNKNLISMEQWDISDDGKEWRSISRKNCIHNDYVYSMCIDENNTIYTSGSDFIIKYWEISNDNSFSSDF